MMILRTGFACALALSIFSVQPAFAIEPDAPDRLLEASDAIALDIAKRMADGPAGLAQSRKTDFEAVEAFYRERSNKPLWVDENGLTEKGKAVAEELKRALQYGLDPKSYVYEELPPGAAGAKPSRSELAAADISLSLAALRYAGDAQGGRIDGTTLSAYLDRKGTRPEPKQVLETLALADAPTLALLSYHPQHPQFEKLRLAYVAKLNNQQQTAELPRIPNGPVLREGMRHPHVAILRQRLEVPATSPELAELFDEAVDDAVKAYQEKNGLRQDGLVGNNTRAAFNKIETGGAKRLLANLELWRWMPRDLGSTHVFVNVPEQSFRVVRNGEIIHTERVIVGKSTTQTPIFSHRMDHLIFHPFWGVPDSIKNNEVLPSLMRGGGGIVAKNNLRIQYRGRDVSPGSINWSTADIRNFHVYQPPGRGNVLGVVKFMFPNKHHVYMHDTPTKHLFNSSTRMYSHGCVRVRDPLKFAEILLREDRGWDMSKINELVKNGPENNQITLNNKIPVHISYFTAAVDADGKLQFWRDVYGHEHRVSMALDGKAHLLPPHREPPLNARPEPIASFAAEQQTISRDRGWVRNVFGGN